MTQYIVALVIAAVAFGLGYTFLSVFFLAVDQFRSRRAGLPVTAQPSISVFKPVKGMDDDLEGNLRSFFEQRYPEFELIFGTDDFDDPAIAVVQRLREQYPQVRARLVVDSLRRGANPKVSNLINMYPWAQYDCLLISDSNVSVGPDYLTHMVAKLERPEVGLVTSTIRGMHAEAVGAALENLHLNSFIAGSVAATRRLFGITIAIGKSMLIRRQTLEQVGGFGAFRNILLEDHVLGLAVERLGLTVEISAHSIANVNRGWGLASFVSRHVRWAMMRRYLNLGNYAAEILSHPIMLALLYWIIDPSVRSLAVLGVAVVAKGLLDAAACHILRSDLRWWMYLLLPAKDVLIAVIWLSPFFGNTVTWRGCRYRLAAGTEATIEAGAVVTPDMPTN